jgi:hypothetical protein
LSGNRDNLLDGIYRFLCVADLVSLLVYAANQFHRRANQKRVHAVHHKVAGMLGEMQEVASRSPQLWTKH